MLLLGGCGFTAAFRGTDWDHPTDPNYTAAWTVIVITIITTVAAGILLRRRAVILTALVFVPFQVWFYVGYAIPAGESMPN